VESRNVGAFQGPPETNREDLADLRDFTLDARARRTFPLALRTVVRLALRTVAFFFAALLRVRVEAFLTVRLEDFFAVLRLGAASMSPAAMTNARPRIRRRGIWKSLVIFLSDLATLLSVT
jgi:hypothetical protein